MIKSYCFICGQRVDIKDCTCSTKITITGKKINVTNNKVFCLCGSNAFRLKKTIRVKDNNYVNEYICYDCGNRIVFTTHKKNYNSNK